ncbi:hypothetical protein ANCCAN_19858 [Ancylostoma caninum]|uniref:Uncharacterized protein n=1 Tax=Ancylostoma caninum TaxID=29170 RepID=A0A368FPZ2_ANCCA|nr:hypothetical protein ANCCAN_19858 [Ancylostoma caninum]
MTGTMFFNVRPQFQIEYCEQRPSYIPAYVVLRLAAIVLQYAIPVWVLRHESIRRVFPMRCSRVDNASQHPEQPER